MFLSQCFSQAKVSWGRGRRVEVEVSIVSPEHKFRIFPGKGTFHPGRAPTLSTRQSFISQRALGDLGHGQPTHWVAELHWGLTRDLMKLPCLTKEGTKAKEGVVAFQGDPVRHWQSCEKDPNSLSHSEEMFPENDLHRQKVNQTHSKIPPMDVI